MAEAKVLIKGWINADCKKNNEEPTTACTVSLIMDGEIIAVVDPGEMPDQKLLVDALAKEDLKVSDITHVFQTHYHIDHSRNTGMFSEKVKVVNEFGEWHEGRDKEIIFPAKYSENIEIIETPGHSHDGLTFLVQTENGKVAVIGDVFWKENYPEHDPYAIDEDKLKASRQKILALADYIVPGHADIYENKK